MGEKGKVGDRAEISIIATLTLEPALRQEPCHIEKQHYVSPSWYIHFFNHKSGTLPAYSYTVTMISYKYHKIKIIQALFLIIVLNTKPT